eukprot:TRINITY_DN68180_c3_g1_i4.p1 TRINITY_DN68180_c3_g1~~TRINITY_DN68180_c3_g1_i4.p1  ORF type:complete len:159 (-),score=0.27 TRINITY_DN68180_c3_g1_i4:1132-1608(-)
MWIFLEQQYKCQVMQVYITTTDGITFPFTHFPTNDQTWHQDVTKPPVYQVAINCLVLVNLFLSNQFLKTLIQLITHPYSLVHGRGGYQTPFLHLNLAISVPVALKSPPHHRCTSRTIPGMQLQSCGYFNLVMLGCHDVCTEIWRWWCRRTTASCIGRL